MLEMQICSASELEQFSNKGSVLCSILNNVRRIPQRFPNNRKTSTEFEIYAPLIAVCVLKDFLTPVGEESISEKKQLDNARKPIE